MVERWMPETNTFHLPTGEATITLNDIVRMTKLKVEGEFLDGKTINYEEAQKLLVKWLGASIEEAKKECSRSPTVSLAWLRNKFQGKLKKDVKDKETIDRYVRGYILYVLGNTIFSDRSGNRVDVYFLENLAVVKDISKFAWGLAALVYLYKQLAFATRATTRQMCGYVYLIEFVFFHEICG
ncbi:protein-serine/threonine phosphatase [Ranunculus cassubicifolius]